MEDCKEANKGFNVAPEKGCFYCKGAGFYYVKNWAKTCECKKYEAKKL